ncbi:MAG: alpha/beta fold hydrolase [Bacteroidota bacterium]
MLHHRIYGKGQPIVILHGLFGMLDNWQSFAKKLSDRYQVIAVDQRNHGRSPRYDEFNYPALAQDLADLLDHLGIETASVLGHSMGGKSAIQFAIDHSDRVDRLVVVDISTRHYPGGHHDIFDAVLSLKVDQISSRKVADDHLSARITDLGVRQFLLKNLSRRQEGGYRWKADFAGLLTNYDHILSEIEVATPVEVRTLFVRGAKSDYIRNDDLDLLRSQFVHVNLTTIDAGHWIHAERPSELLEAVTRFLAG